MRIKWDLTHVKVSHRAIPGKYWLLLLLAPVLATFHFSFLSLIISCSWLSWPVLVFPVWNLPYGFWTIWLFWFWSWMVVARRCLYLFVCLVHLPRETPRLTTSVLGLPPGQRPWLEAYLPRYPLGMGWGGAEMGREWTKVSTFDNIPLSTVGGCLKCFVKLRFQLHPIFI